jgi:hypothetical protein
MVFGLVLHDIDALSSLRGMLLPKPMAFVNRAKQVRLEDADNLSSA